MGRTLQVLEQHHIEETTFLIDKVRELANHLKLAPTNKVDFYKRYEQGEFGNRPRTWSSWQELRDSDFKGRVTIRDMTPGGPCHYAVPVSFLRDGKTPIGVNLNCCRFNEGMPDEDLTIQGNVWHDGHLQLEYSCEPGIGHRLAVKQPKMKSASGLKAVSLLKMYMDPSSYDDLQEMLDTYEGAVIEFSAYGKRVGMIPGRNTVFWEVRNY